MDSVGFNVSVIHRFGLKFATGRTENGYEYDGKSLPPCLERGRRGRPPTQSYPRRVTSYNVGSLHHSKSEVSGFWEIDTGRTQESSNRGELVHKPLSDLETRWNRRRRLVGLDIYRFPDS